MKKTKRFHSKYVVCPFYKFHEHNHISCEGTESNNSVNLTFETKNECIDYSKRYCYDIERYHRCRVCQMLRLKYE